jgi:hypothetical protein
MLRAGQKGRQTSMQADWRADRLADKQTGWQIGRRLAGNKIGKLKNQHQIERQVVLDTAKECH